MVPRNSNTKVTLIIQCYCSITNNNGTDGDSGNDGNNAHDAERCVYDTPGMKRCRQELFQSRHLGCV